jgi:hypothetical protein
MNMLRFLRLSLNGAGKFAQLGMLLAAFSATAQTSGLLRLQQIQVTHAGPEHFTFNDYGTGATNYEVQFSSGLETNDWQVASNAVVTPQGGGSYAVQINNAAGPQGFYRVNGLGGTNGGIVVTFSTTAFQVVEGDTVNTTLVLSQPFHGWIFYTVSGTAGTGDYRALSGSNYVDGTTTTIPVSLTDNNLVGQLKYLTIMLAAGAGYEIGRSPSTTITIGENDADWKGTFIADNANIGFTLMIDKSNGLYQAALMEDGSGFFPPGEIPAALSLTPDSFAATVAGIPLAANATLVNTPASLTLVLAAMNGTPNQTVSDTQIQGDAELITQYAGQPQLNTTNQGTFILLKPPVAPSTNQVQLVNAP